MDDRVRLVEVIAHRGASAYAPEHTLAAYDLALEMGADRLELDVRLTADEELVVLHDRTLARTARDPRPVADLTLAELAELDPWRRPLTLDAVFTAFGRSTSYLLELKEPRPPAEERAVEAIVRHGLAAEVVVQSFCLDGLERVHAVDPTLSLAPLFEQGTAPAAVVAQLDRIAAFATGIGPCRSTVTAGLVDAAHAHGLDVRAWTVNDDAELRRLAAMGVDGLITDVPDRALLATGRGVPVALAA